MPLPPFEVYRLLWGWVLRQNIPDRKNIFVYFGPPKISPWPCPLPTVKKMFHLSIRNTVQYISIHFFWNVNLSFSFNEYFFADFSESTGCNFINGRRQGWEGIFSSGDVYLTHTGPNCLGPKALFSGLYSSQRPLGIVFRPCAGFNFWNTGGTYVWGMDLIPL